MEGSGSGGASVIIRVRNEARNLARCLELVAGQRGLGGSPEVIVVDSGGLARAWWSDTRRYDSAARAQLSHRRAARLLGAYAGRR